MLRRGCAALAALLLMAAGGQDPAAQYDRLLAAHDYDALATQLKHGMESADSAMPTLAWEQQHVASGGSVFIGAMYALDLLSAELPGKDGAAQDAASIARIRQSAVTIALYTMATIETDGSKCVAAEAPVARRRQFVQILTPVWSELRKLPDEQVATVLGQALSEESALAAKRAPDDYLCRGRTDDIPDDIPNAGRAIEPRFRAPADWTERAAAVRAQLPQLMTEFAARVKSGS
jgi:hypothetical protein